MWEVLTHEIAISHDVFTNNEFSTEIETIQKALPFIIIHEQKQLCTVPVGFVARKPMDFA